MKLTSCLLVLVLLTSLTFAIDVEIHVAETNNDGSNMVTGVSDGWNGDRDINAMGPTTRDYSVARRYVFDAFGNPSETSIPLMITRLSDPTYLNLSDDEVSEPIPLPFGVYMYGRVNNYISVSSNGFIFLNSEPPVSTDDGCCAGADLHNLYLTPTAGSDHMVAGVWNDLNPQGGDALIMYGVEGTAPQRVFIVFFYDVNNYGETEGGYTFQIKLFEDGGAGYGFGYHPTPGGDGGGDHNKPLSIDLDPACEGNVVTVTSADIPVNDVRVSVIDTAPSGPVVALGYTDVNGEFVFGDREDCGINVDIGANKAGYSKNTINRNLVSCDQCPGPEPEEPEYECTSDDECLEGQFCDIPTGAAGGNCEDIPEEPEEPGAPGPPECTSDTDCADTHYCTDAGTCMPVSGDCGYIEDHAWVAYECGDEPACPGCPDGFTCVDHACVEEEGGLEGPDEGFEGDNLTYTGKRRGEACEGCKYVLTRPDGNESEGTTGPDGSFIVPLGGPGEYVLTLYDPDGNPIESKTITAFPTPAAEEPEPEEAAGTPETPLASLLLMGLLLAGAIALLAWYRRRRTRKERGTR